MSASGDLVSQQFHPENGYKELSWFLHASTPLLHFSNINRAATKRSGTDTLSSVHSFNRIALQLD